jgi:hypothetical protein
MGDSEGFITDTANNGGPINTKTIFSVLYGKDSNRFMQCHSSHSLSYNRSNASSKTISLQSVNRRASCSFQYSLVFLRPYRSCLLLLPRLPVTPIFPSNFPSTACFSRQFLCKMWLIHLDRFLFYCSWGVYFLLDSNEHWFIFQAIYPTHNIIYASKNYFSFIKN